jgi:hypothetical protein
MPAAISQSIDAKEWKGYSIDTIHWSFIEGNPIELTPYPTTQELAYIKTKLKNTQKLENYSITLMLPFLSSRVTAEDQIFTNRLTSMSFHFYNGFYQAIKNYGNIHLNVVDTEANPTITERKLKQDNHLKETNLIVGPYRTTTIEKVNEYANQNNIPFFSPFSAGADLQGDNPFYIKLNPGLEDHFRVQLTHALQSYSPDELIVLGFSGTQEEYATNLLIDLFNREFRLDESQTIKSKFISEADALKNIEILTDLRKKRNKLAIFIPSWSNQTYISSVLRNLSLKQNDTIAYRIYGMPQWMDFEFVDYEYFEKLNVHLTAPVFIDEQIEEIQLFKESYFNQFGVIPEKEAYLGYDIAEFFANMLLTYGTKFQFALPYEEKKLMTTKFKFKPVYDFISPEETALKRWENNYLHILKFKEFKFSIDQNESRETSQN